MLHLITIALLVCKQFVETICPLRFVVAIVGNEGSACNASNWSYSTIYKYIQTLFKAKYSFIYSISFLLF